MKKLRTLAALLTMLTLTSCGGGKGPSTPNSTTPSPAVSTTPNKDTSKGDKTDSTPTPPTPVVEPKIKATLMAGENEATAANLVEGGGALTLQLSVENLPDGVTADQVTWTLPARSNARLNLLPRDENSKANELQFTAMMPGTEVIHVEAKVGEKTIALDYELKITRDDKQYKTISTAKELEALLAQTTVTDKYMLAADIDLGGKDIKAATTFNGVLDGNGHKISNFNIVGYEGTVGNEAAGGLFQMVHGLVRRVEIKGNLNVPSGYAGIVAKEVGEKGIIEDCLVTATNLTECLGENAWTSKRNGVVVACVSGTIQNVVAIITNDKDADTNEKYSQTLDVAAYLYTSKGIINNVYVNRNETGLQKPFDPSYIPDQSDRDQFTVVFENFHPGLGDFSASKAEDFALDPTLWTLEDGKAPVLKKETVSVTPTPEPETPSDTPTDTQVEG